MRTAKYNIQHQMMRKRGFMMKKIVISNLKGGVGKTTTTVNLAYSFMQLRKKVLVVDADPQANTTPFFLSKINKGCIYAIPKCKKMHLPD